MKKQTKTAFVIFTSIVLLAIIFGIIDYKVTKDYRPILSIPGKLGEQPENKINYRVYYGLGYKIVVCHNAYSDIYIFPFYIGKWQCQSWFDNHVES